MMRALLSQQQSRDDTMAAPLTYSSSSRRTRSHRPTRPRSESPTTRQRETTRRRTMLTTIEPPQPTTVLRQEQPGVPRLPEVEECREYPRQQPARNPRRRMRSSLRPYSQPPILYLITFLLGCCLFLPYFGVTALSRHASCWEALGQSNADNNDYLSADEFASFLEAFTLGGIQWERDRDALGGDLISSYTSRADAATGQLNIAAVVKGRDGELRSTADEIESVEGFCTDIEAALYAHYFGADASAIDLADCIVATGEDEIMTEAEFPAFVMGIDVGGFEAVTFAALPAPVQAVFRAYQTSAGGADSGQVIDTGGAAEQDYLGMCYETVLFVEASLRVGIVGADGVVVVDVVVDNAAGGTAAPGVDEGGTGTGTDTGGADDPNCVAVFEEGKAAFDVCTEAAVLADADQDDLLTQAEYAAFVAALACGSSAIKLDSYEFDALPEPIQFGYLASRSPASDAVNLKNLQTGNYGPTSLLRIQFFCYRTMVPTYQELGIGGGEPPDVGFESFEGIDTAGCLSHARVADADQDSYLSKDEYAAFVILVAGADAVSSQYKYQDKTLKVNFDMLGVPSTGLVDVLGIHSDDGEAVKPPFAYFCGSTYSAILSVLEAQGATILPFVGDDTSVSPGTAPPGADGSGTADPSGAGEGTTPPLAGTNETTTDSSCGGTAAPGEDEGTLAPITEEFYASCIKALIISDTSRDDQLSDTEYVTFLNRLSDSAFSGKTLEQLPPVFQSSYQDLAGEQGSVDVAGSKPYQQATEEQTANLQVVCTAAGHSIERYNNGDDGADTSCTDATDGPDDDGAEDITDLFFTQCRTAMVIGDSSRDGNLDSTEYVRFINRLMASAFDGVTYGDLDPAFQSSFNRLSGGAVSIDVSAAKPGAQLTDDSLAYLRSICVDTNNAINIYNNPDLTVPPDDGTPAPTIIPSAFLSECKSALTVADRNRDSTMDQDEYIRFVNRLMGATFTAFADLDEALQSNYDTISEGNSAGVDVSSSQSDHIVFICSETEKAIDGEGGGKDNEYDITTCLQALEQSDINKDGELVPIEYVFVLNSLLDNKFEGKGYADLDDVFRVAYVRTRGEGTFIDVSGATDETPSETVKTLCAGIFDAIDLYENPVEEGVDDCLAALASQAAADPVDKDVLGEDEYVALVMSLAEGYWQGAASMDELPFAVQENYEWIKFGSTKVDVSGLDSEEAATPEQTRNLQKICIRTITALKVAMKVSDESDGTPLAYCTTPLLIADADTDYQLDQTEFLIFIDYVSGKAWNGVPYDSLDPALKDLFGTFMDSTSSSIPLAFTDLESLCSTTLKAVTDARVSSTFYDQCKDALAASDANADTLLSEDEYVTFIHIMTGQDSSGKTFADLPQLLQYNWELIRFRQSQADISGSGTGETPTVDQEENLRAVCSYTQTALPALEPPATSPPVSGDASTATIYNSFIVSNTKGLEAASLEGGLNRAGLEKAYAIFSLGVVDGSSRLRGRALLEVGMKTNSAVVYEMVDTVCPTGAEVGAICQIAYASFELLVPESSDINALVEKYTVLTQESIEEGNLQMVLSIFDESNDLTVTGASRPLQPPASTPTDGSTTAPAPTTPPSAPSSFFTLPVMIGIAAGGAVLLFGIGVALYCWCDRRRRRKTGPDVDKDARRGSSPHGDYDPNDPDGRDQERFEDEYDPEQPRQGSAHEEEAFGNERQASKRELYEDEPQYDDGYDQSSPRGGRSNHYEEDDDGEADQYGDQYGERGQYDDQDYGERDPYAQEDAYAEDIDPDGDLFNSAPPPQQENDSWSNTEDQWAANNPEQQEGDFFEANAIENQYEIDDEYNPQASPSRMSRGSKTSRGSQPFPISPDEIEIEMESEEGGSESDESTLKYGSSDDEEEEEEEEEESDEEDDSDDDSAEMDDTIDNSVLSSSQTAMQYRNEIIALVKQVVPDELDNVDAMIEQFHGREDELLSTLQNMADMAAQEPASSEEESEGEEEESEEEESEYESESEEEEQEEGSEEYEDESEEEGSAEEEGSEEYESEYEDEYSEEEVTEEEEEDGEEEEEVEDGSSYYSEEGEEEEEESGSYYSDES